MLDTSDAVVKALVDAAQVSGASTNGFLAGMKGCKVARVVVGEPGRRQSSGSGGCSVYRHELMESLGYMLLRLFFAFFGRWGLGFSNYINWNHSGCMSSLGKLCEFVHIFMCCCFF